MDRVPTTVRLAGAPVVLPAGHGDPVALAERDAALLAWLVLEGPTPRLRVLALLWPERDVEAARNLLRQRLFKLRRVVGVELVSGQVTLQLADGIAHDLDGARTLLGSLPSPVGGEFAYWLDRQRVRLRARQQQALFTQIESAELRHDWHDALRHAHDLLALDPLSEAAHRHVMQLHYAAGDRAAALLAFDRCAQALKDEVGVLPSPETLALLRTVQQAGAAEVTRRRVPAAVVRPPRVIGRDAQWAALVDAWEAGQRVLLLGEGGMGKTRLARDFAATQGAVLVAGARPGDDGVVYASFTRLLRALPREALAGQPAPVRDELARLLPELGSAEPANSDMERARFVNATIALFDDPALGLDGVVFDDLHFADDASLELLQRVSAASRLRWVVAGREGELRAGSGALLDAFEAGTDARRIVLTALTPEQVTELVASLGLEGIDAEGGLASLSAQLWRSSGGNPLWLLETLKMWFSSGQPAGAMLPAAANVVTLIDRRMARLSQAAVHLARCAAIAAPDFDIELATAVLGVRTLDLADPVAELEAAQILRDGAFAHDLIYESARASVPRVVARQLHAEIAAFLAQRGGEPARVAAHWLEAGNDARALEALWQAAGKARSALRKREEVELLRKAASAAERVGERGQVFDALRLAFDAMMVADRTHIDAAFLARLDAFADKPPQRLQALLARIALAGATGDYASGLELAETAVALARQLGLPREEVEVLRGAAASASFSGDNVRALRLLRPVLPLVQSACSPADQQSYFNDLACCLDNADQHGEAEACHRRAIELALQIGRLDQASIACANMAFSLKQQGHLESALAQVQQAQRYLLGFDESQATSWNIDMMSLALTRDLGRYDEAIRFDEAARRSIQQNPGARVVLDGHRAQFWIVLGQYARAKRLLDEVDIDSLPPFQRGRRHQLRGRLQRGLGQGGQRAFEEAVRAMPPSGRFVSIAMVRLDQALTLPPADALTIAEDVLGAAQSAGHSGLALAAQVRAAAFALAHGDVERAAALGQSALDGLARGLAPDDLYRGEVWWAAAQAFIASGRSLDAAAAAAAGSRWVRDAAGRLPVEFRPSFLERNPVNRDLLALAGRLAVQV